MKRISHGATLRAVIAGAACASVLVTAACGNDDPSGGASSNGGTAKRTVVFMAPNTTPTRYIQQDGPDFEKAMKALDPNVTVKFVNANGDSTTQLSQANAAIAAGAKALVVVAADPNLSAGLLQAADQAKVPVIGYENPPIKGKMYAQVVFDPKKAGAPAGQLLRRAGQERQARRQAGHAWPARTATRATSTRPRCSPGRTRSSTRSSRAATIKVVCEDYIKDWAPDNATKATEQCLTKTQNKVTAFLGLLRRHHRRHHRRPEGQEPRDPRLRRPEPRADRPAVHADRRPAGRRAQGVPGRGRGRRQDRLPRSTASSRPPTS